MILTTASFKGGAPHPTHVFRHTVSQEFRRNTLFLVVFCLVAFFLVLMPAVTQLIDQNVSVISETLPGAEAAAEAITDASSPLRENQSYQFGMGLGAVVILPVLAMILALLQFAYLSNRRAMDVFGALPVRRETMLGAKMSSGLVILFLPVTAAHLLIFLLNLILVGYHPYLLWETLLVLLESFVLMLIPYCLTMLVSTLSGTVLENILYPLTLIFAPVVLYLLGQWIFSSAIYGYMVQDGWDQLFGFLCPYYTTLVSAEGFLSSEGIATYLLAGRTEDAQHPAFWELAQIRLLPILLWLGICVIVTVLAVICIKRRRSERAGIKGASKALNVLACLLTVITGSLMVFALFAGGWFQMGQSIFSYIWLFLAILIIFAVYQLVTLQSARAMLRSWPLCAVCVGLGAVFVVFLNTNAFGIYSAIPEQEEVESVEVSYAGMAGISGDNALSVDVDAAGSIGGVYTDPDVIAAVIDFHQAALTAQDEGRENENWGYDLIQFRYRMKDGGVMARQYSIATEEMGYAIGRLNEADAFLEKNHIIFQEDLTRYDTVRISDPYHSRFTDVPLESIDLTALQQAIQQDVLDDTLEEMLSPAEREIGWIHLWDTDEGEEDSANSELSILIKGNYDNTIAYLSALGLLGEMDPDYSAIQEIAIFTPVQEDAEHAFPAICLYGNIDYSLRMFTKNWSGGLTLSEDYDLTLEEAAIEPNRITDPEQIQSILEGCYNQSAYQTDSCSVYVRTLESTTEMILPNP